MPPVAGVSILPGDSVAVTIPAWVQEIRNKPGMSPGGGLQLVMWKHGNRPLPPMQPSLGLCCIDGHCRCLGAGP